MGQPAAKKGDAIVSDGDTHQVEMAGSPPTVQMLPKAFPFRGEIAGDVSGNVKIMGLPAATVGSTAKNQSKHVLPPGATKFVNEPKNEGKIVKGSATVRINGKAAARHGDTAETCNDPAPAPVGTVVATGTVSIG